MNKQIKYHVNNWCGNTIYASYNLEESKNKAEEYAFDSGSDVEVVAYDADGEEIFLWETHLGFYEC